MKKILFVIAMTCALLGFPSVVNAQEDWKNEPEAQFVERAYAALHGRVPDEGGWVFWVGELETQSPERIIERILESPEFVDNDPTFVEVYADLFDREIDPSGAAFWPTQDYLFAVTHIVTSEEALGLWGHSAIPVIVPPEPAYRSVWDDVAWCESGGDWSINTGNGYYGGLQFSLSSWRYVGGTGYPHEASKAEQIKRAELLVATPPYQRHWPVCGPRAGL